MTRAGNRPSRGVTPVLMRGLLVLAFLLAVGAIALAVFSDEVRWLKLAALLGVWAAFTAAFPVVYFRRSARAAELKTEESKRTYELELHREITARREYEIGVSEAAREDAESRHREELAGLREQLDRLNTTLSGLLDGDLLFERLTLSAESTRVRQVGDAGRNRLLNMARPGQIEHSPEPTGPYIGHQSAAPSAIPVPGPISVPGHGGPYPVREDDTIQFPRAMFGPGAQPVPEPVVETVVEPEPEMITEPDPEVIPEPEPEVIVEAELAVEPEPEVTAEPESVQPEPEPVQPEPEPEPVTSFSEPEPVEPATEQDAATGHSAGISVADLLAAYGSSDTVPRRRRRAED